MAAGAALRAGRDGRLTWDNARSVPRGREAKRQSALRRVQQRCSLQVASMRGLCGLWFARHGRASASSPQIQMSACPRRESRPSTHTRTASDSVVKDMRVRKAEDREGPRDG
jgi:hypothetical protein